MSLRFVSPEFLFALALIAIPIIVHLFNFRKFKKVAFTNVQFLKELKEETNSRSKLKHLLVLLSRILAVVFLVFAFAQPYIPQNKTTVLSTDKAISIFIDNSFSMEVVGKEGTLIQQAQSKAKEIAMAYKASDRFQLLTDDFAASQQRLLSREEFLDQLQLVKISSSTKTISEIALRQKEALLSSGAKDLQAYIISDFQKSNYNLSTLKTDSGITTSLIPLDSKKKNNVYIDSCWLASPVVQLSQPIELNVRLQNAGDNDAENVPLKLIINGINKSVTSLTINAGKSIETKLSFTVSQPGWQAGQVVITDYPITFDDSYYFAFNMDSSATIVSINQSGESPYLKRVFEGDQHFVLQNYSVNQMVYTDLQKSQVAVLNNLKTISSGLTSELKKFCDNGGTLVIFPDSGADKAAYNELLLTLNADAINDVVTSEEKVSTIELQSELYKNVFPRLPENMDVPLTHKHFSQAVTSRSNREVMLKLQGGDALLSSYKAGKGKMYLFTIPLNNSFSNLVDHYLFAPTIYNIALYSQQQTALSFTLGNNPSFAVDETVVNGEAVFHLTNPALNFDVIPEHRNNAGQLSVYFGDQVKQAGNYQLKMNNQIKAVVAVNYNRSESDLACFTADELEEQIVQYKLPEFKVLNAIEGSVTKQLSELSEGIRLWKWCIMLAMLFLAFEVLLLRFLKQ